MALAWAGRTDVGRVRSQNQDRFRIDAGRGIFILADGMGGAAAGDVAAQTVVDMLPQYMERYLGNLPTGDFVQDLPSRLKSAIADLSLQIRKVSSRSVRQAGMGTTLVVVVAGETEVMVGHVGDSRAYLFRDGRLHQVTSDHTLAQALIDSGDLTVEEASSQSGLQQLTRYVGMEEPPVVDVSCIQLFENDRLLMCSDGLTSMVSDADVSTILSRFADPDDACGALVDAANAAGGRDNTTVVVLQRESHVADEQLAHVEQPAYSEPPAPSEEFGGDDRTTVNLAREDWERAGTVRLPESQLPVPRSRFAVVQRLREWANPRCHHNKEEES